jgi:hypothetical protein
MYVLYNHGNINVSILKNNYYFKILEEIIFENFNISENNIISVELAKGTKVLDVCSLHLTPCHPILKKKKHILSI